MRPTGAVALKMKYLGGVYPGQDLCWCKIEIGENAIQITRFRAGTVVGSKFIDFPAVAVSQLKQKLRVFVMRKAPGQRWQVRRARGVAIMYIYYPSASWAGGRGVVRWMVEGSL